MELNGKCEYEFRQWYVFKHKKTFSINYLEMIVMFFGQYNNSHYKAFECSPPEMKFGVFVDFSNTTKYRISLTSLDSHYDHWNYKIVAPHENGMDIIVHKGDMCGLHEAMIGGVEKFNDLFNEQNK